MFSSAYFWITIALIAFFVLVVWKGLQPVLNALDARAARIRKEIDDAQQLRDEAQRLLADYKRRQRDALKEAEEIVAHAKAEAERLRRTSEQELEETLERRERLALEKLRQAEQAAVAEVRSQAVDLAIAAASRLIAANLDEKRAAELTSQSIEEVSQKLN